MKRLLDYLGAAAILQGILTVLAIGAVPDTITVLVPSNHVSYGGTFGGPIGGYVYQSSGDRFYVSTYGSGRGIRVFVGPEQPFPLRPDPNYPLENPLQTDDGKSWQCATDSDLFRVMGATSFEGGTTILTSHLLNGAVLNPQPVTVNGYTYGAGELAVLSNNTTSSTVALTKRLITWDFREIWSPTNKQPDRANAEYAPGILEVDHFGQQYGYGCTNWNDAYNCLMTLGNMADAIGASVPFPITSDNMGGRRATFSSDGSKVYFIAMDSRTGRQFTGVWSVELSTKEVHRLFDDTPSVDVRTCSEPASVSIGVRNFTGQNYPAGVNQVLFNGTEASGNVGGINALADGDSADPNIIYPVVDAQQLLAMLGMDPNTEPVSRPKVWSITVDAEGNVYFYLNSPNGLYQYDTEGRLLCIVNKLQHFAFNMLVLNSNSTNTAYNRLDLREVSNPYDPNHPDDKIIQLMFMSVGGKCVAGANVYKPIDFDRDGQVTVADLNFFKTQIRKTWDGADPNVPDDSQEYLDYIRADLNGDGDLNDTRTYTTGPSVTEEDREVLWQFVRPGDADLNHRIDMQDYAVVAFHFNESEKDWSQGDFDFDDDVDWNDFVLLTEYWLNDYD
jgi:hypothetical protein